MFVGEDYFHNMLTSFEVFLKQLLPFAILCALGIGLVRVLYLSVNLLFFFDVGLVLTGTYIYFNFKRIQPLTKVLLLAALLSLIAMILYLYYSYFSSFGIIILVMSSFLVMIFGSQMQYRTSLIANVMALIGVFYYGKFILLTPSINGHIYILHIISYLVFMEVLRLAVGGVKHYISSHMIMLKDQLVENELITKELAIQNAEVKMHEKEIYNLAFYDQLTQLPKRNLMERYVSKRLQLVSKGLFVLIDLKGFKVINTIYGAKFGDRIIKLIGDIANEYADDSVFTGRINGNEFAIWVENRNKEAAIQLLTDFNERLQGDVQKILLHNQVKFHVAHSEFPRDGSSFDDLYNKANIALNYGKANEISTYVSFEGFMEKKLLYENNFKRVLEEALTHKEFELHYQEKFDSLNGKVTGLEALSRWSSKKLGKIPPSEFIPMIAKYNLVEKFGEMVIEFVFRDIELIQSKYGDIKVGINISPDHLISDNFMPFVTSMRDKYNICSSSIIFEITEEVMIKGINSVESILNDIRSKGYRISLDDFGSGYSSLNYLARLPFDEIKIDKAFVDEIENEKVRKVLETVIELKKIYNVDVIAEGVEKKEQLECLQAIGCYTIQGYYFSKPSPLSALVF